MEFDKSNVYTAVNADVLGNGDIVCVADTLSELKSDVQNEEVTTLELVLADDNEYRFAAGNGLDYILAYLVCPAHNVEAYKAWSEGKAVERRLCDDKESLWVIRYPDRDIIDDWTSHTYRVHQEPEEKPESKYRPYKSVDELVSDFKERFSKYTPAYAMTLIWVKKERGGIKRERLITAFEEIENLVSIDGEIYDLEYLYKDYTFLDGSPCGVQE